MSLFASWKRAAGALLLAGTWTLACSSAPAKVEENDRICTPGTNVVCKCANLATGTKLCNDDGDGYETECAIDGNTECPGGELPSSSSSSGGRSSSSSSSSSGGSGGNPDACPGDLVAVPPNAPIEISNSTDGATDDESGTEGCSAGAGAPDHVYRLVPSGRGALKIEVSSSTPGYAPLVYLRRGDCDAGAQVGCDAAGAGESAEFTVDVVENEPYWLVVDGAAGPDGQGEYRVKATLTPGTFCGDTVADQDEVCDDGNNVDGDGCAADCTNFNGNPTSAVQCPGQQVHLWADSDVFGTGSTSGTKLIGAKNDFHTVAGNCQAFSASDVSPGDDHVYELIAHGAGELLVTVTNPTFDAKATTWTTCEPTVEESWDQCAIAADPPATFDVPMTQNDTIHLTDGQHYTLVLDGRNGESGDYNLELFYLGE